MTRLILLCIFTLCATANAQGIEMREVFKQMPDSLVPALTLNNRLDMIDFIDSNMEADVKNKLDEHSKLTVLTDNYLHLDISEVSTIELRLLPTSTALPDSSNAVVCMVQTLNVENGESVVELYTSKWRKLRTVTLQPAQIVLPDTMNAERKGEILSLTELMMCTATLSPTQETLTVSPTLPLISAEDKAAIEPYIRPLTLKWDGLNFK